jgi:hypothetical protein
MGAVKALSDDGLFVGQPPVFSQLLQDLAAAAMQQFVAPDGRPLQ